MKLSPLSPLALAMATGVFATLPAALPASAQQLERGATVLERPRPEVEQLGMRAGSFRVLPRIETGLTYDSNVLATERNAEDDFIWVTRPEIEVRSDFGRHALNFTANAELGRYIDTSSENYLDYGLRIDGRYDLTRDASIDAAFGHRRDHEGRSDPDADLLSGLAKPQKYSTTGGDIGYTQRFNRVRVRVTGGAHYVDYSDAQLVGGFRLDGDERDRWEYSTSARVGYEFIAGYEMFLQGGYNWTNYRRGGGPFTFNRDSDGYEVVAGVSGDLTGLVTGEAYVGWMSRNYTDSRLKDYDGLALGGQLRWAVTQLTSVTGQASRTIRDTTYARGLNVASSYDRTVVALGVDHELLRTLLLNGRLQWRQDDFNGADRTDNVYTAGIGATYQVNRNLYLTGGYTHERRQSNVPGGDYNDNILFLRIGAQM